MAARKVIVGWTSPLITHIVSVKLPTLTNVQGASPGDNNLAQIPFIGEQASVVEIETLDVVAAQALDGTKTAGDTTVTAHYDDGTTNAFVFKRGYLSCNPNAARNRTAATATLTLAPIPDDDGEIIG